MSAHRVWLTVGTCGLLAAPLAGCAADAPAGGEPAVGGTAVIAGPTDPGPLNPLIASDDLAGELARHALYLTLIELGPELDYRPRLAESWTEEGDSAVVFRLRRDVRWEDGRPTTAADVVFTFERATDPETAFPFAGRFERWLRVEAADSFTVRAVMEPHPEALAAWVATPIVAEHHLSAIPPAELRTSEEARRTPGNGPFRLVERRTGDRLVLEANPDFPADLGGRPRLDRVVYRVIPDATAQVAELRAGVADVLLHLPVTEAPRLEALDSARVIRGAWRQFTFVAWNARRPPFDRADVRRALSLAVDRAEMVTLLRSGFGIPAAGPLPPAHWAFADGLEPLPHDPEGARALLDGAGLVDSDGDGVREARPGVPFSVELKYPAQDPIFRNAAELVRSDLREVGVQVTPQGLEAATLIAQVTSPERPFDAVLLTWGLEIPARFRDLFHSEAVDGPFQLAGYRNPVADTLLDGLERPAAREEAGRRWADLQRLLREEQPWTFLYYYPVLAARSERIHGVDMDLRGQLVSLARWWVSGGDPSPAGEGEITPDP